jgi:hypothetical protein
MVQKFHIWRYSGISLMLMACSCLAIAQNGVFSLGASSGKIGVKDQLQITFTIKNIPNVKDFFPVGLENDFNVLGGPYQGRSYNFTIINNRQVQEETITISYLLQPKHEGNLSIQPGIVKDGAGHSLQSNSLNIQVVAGSLAATRQQRQANPYDPYANNDPFDPDPFGQMLRQRQQNRQQQGQAQQNNAAAAPAVDEKALSKDIFIKVSVDKNKAHIGEQITASYKLYSRIPMQANISKLPSLNGFWTQDFEIPKTPKPQEEIVNGKKFQVFLLKKSALFPQQTGTLELDPAEAEGSAKILQQIRQRNPFADMFDDPAFRNMGSLLMSDPMFNSAFFNSIGYRDVPVHLKSTPVKITVTALPDKGKPTDFSGAVGNFKISAKVNKTDISTDDALTYTLNISGSGNLKLIEIPKLNLPNGLDTYDPQVIDTITGRSTIISGNKIITYTLTAHTPGDYTLAPIPFTYYNPETGKYVSLQTEAIKLHVNAGKHYSPTVVSNNATLALKDIHDINTQASGDFKPKAKPLFNTPGYWSLYGLSILSMMMVAFWKKRDEELLKDSALLRNKRANKVALKRLTTAKKYLTENKSKPFYEEISKAVWLYLSDKLSIELSGLSKESAFQALSQQKISEELKKEIEHLITECETALYAPLGGSKQMDHVYNESIGIISKLEDSL